MKEKVFELYIQDPMGVKGDWFFLPMPENELKVKLKSLFKEEIILSLPILTTEVLPSTNIQI